MRLCIAIAMAGGAVLLCAVPVAAQDASHAAAGPVTPVAAAAEQATASAPAPTTREHRLREWRRGDNEGPWTQATLFGGDKRLEHGGFGGLVISGSELLGDTSIMVGGAAAGRLITASLSVPPGKGWPPSTTRRP